MNKDQKLLAETYSKVLEENAQRSAAGLDMDGLMTDQERYEKELDKKEAYKASLARHNSDQDYLESIANELFNIGSRINSGNIRPEDGNYLQEIAGDVEHLAAKLK
jgi:hypothetical protein